VDRAQIGVLEETDEIRFRRFLESAYSGALETQVGLEILGDFTNQPLERQLPDQQLGRLLVSSNFSKCYGTGPVTMRLLHATGGRRALPGRLRRELLAGSFTSR